VPVELVASSLCSMGVHDRHAGAQATSALDNASERIVQQALDRLAKARAPGCMCFWDMCRRSRPCVHGKSACTRENGLYMRAVEFAEHAWCCMRTRHTPSRAR